MRGDAFVESRTSAARARVNVCFIAVVTLFNLKDEMCAGLDKKVDSVTDLRFILLQPNRRIYNYPQVDSNPSISGGDSILSHA
jgi:hypothetical protein